MSDDFSYWMFCSIAAICITWYMIKTRNDPPSK